LLKEAQSLDKNLLYYNAWKDIKNYWAVIEVWVTSKKS